MDELKGLNLTLGFYFLKNLKNLNSDFFGFLGFLKKPKNLGFLKTCQTALLKTWVRGHSRSLKLVDLRQYNEKIFV